MGMYISSVSQVSVCVCVSDLLGLAVARQLHRHSRQVGGVGEGEEGSAGASSEHVLLHLRSLVAPPARTQQEQQEELGEEVGGAAWRSHGGAVRPRRSSMVPKSQQS